MAAAELGWSRVQQKTNKPLLRLREKIEAQVANRFGKYPTHPWDRQQFEIKVREAAVEWARRATEIYCKTLLGFGYELSPAVIATAWGDGLSGFLRHVIHPQLVLAFGVTKEDSRWISFGPKHWNTAAAGTALARSAAIGRIYDNLEKRTREYEWWSPSQQKQQVSVSSSENQSCAKERRAAVDSYIDEVLQKKGVRITRRQFWSKAGYKTRSEFERWQSCDPKRVNKSAKERFEQILRQKPHLK